MTPKFDKLVEENWKAWLAAAGLLGGNVDVDAASRGQRNNNPGNIKHGQTWQGEVKGTDKTFEKFKSVEYGVRAIGITIRTYNIKYNLDTVESIISRWAPPSENKTKNYINFVSKQLGVKSNAKLGLFKGKEISNRKALKLLIIAIIRMETSHTYPDKVIEGGLTLITPVKSSKTIVYTIKSGDNLSKIASIHSTSVKAIQQANPQIKDINKIFPNQKINIPQ